MISTYLPVLSSTTKYDYIITGTGCAGLSLVMHMIHTGEFSNKKILLVDKEKKSLNDRTWCFWEINAGLFEAIVYKQWNNLWFKGNDFSKLFSISPYTYKLIRGVDFYNYCFNIIDKQPNIDVLIAPVEEINSSNQSTYIIADGKTYEAQYIFNSILFEKPKLSKKDYYLLQHFKGWIIETADTVFNENEATLMDFTVSQDAGATFVYVMPFTSRCALVEYTLFTKELLSPKDYDEGLKSYISKQLSIAEYKVKEEEFGIIPMTNHQFPVSENNIIQIGTAGGQTKASSGYTFQFIQKQSAAIVSRLSSEQFPLIKSKRRFHFYDSTLLSILSDNSLPAATIFSTLFKKNKPQQVLRFLDNESSLTDELNIISSLPTWPFLKAAIRQF